MKIALKTPINQSMNKTKCNKCVPLISTGQWNSVLVKTSTHTAICGNQTAILNSDNMWGKKCMRGVLGKKLDARNV